MRSRFLHLKKKAVHLRKEGESIGRIEARLGIPRSTLSYWFRGIELTGEQKEVLNRRWKEGLVSARIKASAWHRANKAARLAKVAESAEKMLDSLDMKDPAFIELALAFLYLGEGTKNNSNTSIGSSDLRIARFFLRCLQKIYAVPIEKIKCDLHLRDDQDPMQMTAYWAKALGLPKENFCKPSIDERTRGRPTYHHYKGVCVIRCGRVEIQRRLMYIANGFCEKITGVANLGG